MKRLLCILSNMNAGGAESFLMKLYRAIDKDMYQFDFCLTAKEPGFYDKEIERLGGIIYHIPSKSESLHNFKIELANIVSKYKYILRITANGAGLLDIKIAKKNGATICSVRSSNSNTEGGLKEKIAHILGKALYMRFVDKKIAPSDLSAKYTFGKKAYESGEVTILRNALDLNQFQFRLDARNRIRKEFGFSDKDYVVGHVGRFMTQKNHAFLIDIFDEIHRLNPNSKLLLVGNGELQSTIRTKVCHHCLDDSVVFANIRGDVPAILCAMDVFVMPSLYEGMPNSVIEAQATGLPCVISDTITTEANITGLVEYLSLQSSPYKWANCALKAGERNRTDTHEQLISAGYDIESTVQLFLKTVFDE